MKDKINTKEKKINTEMLVIVSYF